MKYSQYPFSLQVKTNLEQLQYKKPTDIQYKSIPHILKGEDLLAIAQTGTGKTAAFAIPLIDQIEKNKKSRRAETPQALILVPTRELAFQIERVFHSIGQKTKVKVFAITGGLTIADQKKSLQNGVDILIATPGRMFDLINQKILFIDKVKTLVLDEADRMLDPAFIKDIQYIKKLIPHPHQTLFFSATIDKTIKKIAYSLISGNAIRIQISPKNPVSKNVHHRILFIEMDDKRFFLERWVNEHPQDKMIVFVRTRVRAERVAKAMQRVGISSLVIHGEREQAERTAAIDQFRESPHALLIATDVTARGIDIPDIRFVINYDLPDLPENYVHRVGRTGRGFNKGIALSFCSPEEQEKLHAIEDYIQTIIEPLPINTKGIKLTKEKSQTAFAWAPLFEEEARLLGKKKKKKTKNKRKKK